MLLLLAACGSPTVPLPDDTAPADDASAVYDPDVLHAVAITIDPADWDALRVEERTYYDLLGPGCMEGPFESPYEWYPAEVTFDGDDLGEIGVRKKGLIGSNSHERPSLRMDLDHYTDDERWHGLEKIVLNNNNQDTSRLRTCVAHTWFAQAGLVAPRCSLAHVVVNGEDLGVYDNTEVMDEHLVERVRGEEPTTMYEGTLSDFRDGWMATFDPKNDDSDGSDIAAVTAALESDDDHLLEELDAVLDLDAYFTFWAAEAFAGHWDGYNANTNNFYVYGDPEDGRLAFIASGPDAAFDSRAPFDPIWVPTVSALSNRLIQHPEGKERYEAELTRLATEVWDGEEMVDRIDAWKELAHDDLSLEERGAVRDLRAIVEAKADDILAAMGGDVTPAEMRGDFCWTDIGSVTVDFSTTWGTYPRGDLYAGGDATTSYEISGVTYTSLADGVSAGDYTEDQAIWLTISEVAEGAYLAPYAVFDPTLLEDGVDLPIDGHMAQAALMYSSSETGGTFQVAAYLDGFLSFDQASAEEGAPLVGTLTAGVLGSDE